MPAIYHPADADIPRGLRPRLRPLRAPTGTAVKRVPGVVKPAKVAQVKIDCLLCGTSHSLDEDPIRLLKGHQLIKQMPHIFLFFGKKIYPIGRTSNGAKSYPPPPTPEPFLGLEVEVDLPKISPYDTATKMTKQGELADIWQELGLGYTKLDGTVTGVESVTFPHTFDRLRNSGFEEALRAFKKAGAAAWERTGPGLHIHVNRTAFIDKEHMWRFCAIHEANEGILRQLAGRKNNYNPWPDGRYYPTPTRCLDGLEHAVRLTAINLQPIKTIELRFWQGTLQPVGALGAAAVESAIFEYTKKLTATHQVTDELYKWASMLEWAKTNLPDEYARILALTDLRSGKSTE